MSNTPPLTEYFLTDEYKDEINRDNPLGMKGEIATAYAELIRQIWSGEHSYVAPRMFKVGRPMAVCKSLYSIERSATKELNRIFTSETGIIQIIYI